MTGDCSSFRLDHWGRPIRCANTPEGGDGAAALSTSSSHMRLARHCHQHSSPELRCSTKSLQHLQSIVRRDAIAIAPQPDILIPNPIEEARPPSQPSRG